MVRKNAEAFTLIELSISLVIIGLIVGGILGARDLVKQAQLRAVITDITDIKTMIHTFKLKYSGYPGDITNASSYWPSCDATPANCNGNGDGIITETTESNRAWQQLTDSGIMPGSYPGTGSPVPGVVVPASPIEPGGYDLREGSASIAPTFTRSIVFAKKGGVGDRINHNIISAPNAQSIDEKMDDGLAPSGEVRAKENEGDPEGTKCAINVGTDDNYDLSDTTRACFMFFQLH